MSHAKDAPKRKRLSKAVPTVGIAGMSLAMAGGASAATAPPTANLTSQHIPLSHEIILGKRKSLTSAWARSLSSTRKMPHPSSVRMYNLPEAAAEVADAAAEVEDAAAAAADVAAADVAAADMAAADAAAA